MQKDKQLPEKTPFVRKLRSCVVLQCTVEIRAVLFWWVFMVFLHFFIYFLVKLRLPVNRFRNACGNPVKAAFWIRSLRRTADLHWSVDGLHAFSLVCCVVLRAHITWHRPVPLTVVVFSFSTLFLYFCADSILFNFLAGYHVFRVWFRLFLKKYRLSCGVVRSYISCACRDLKKSFRFWFWIFPISKSKCSWYWFCFFYIESFDFGFLMWKKVILIFDFEKSDFDFWLCKKSFWFWLWRKRFWFFDFEKNDFGFDFLIFEKIILILIFCFWK